MRMRGREALERLEMGRGDPRAPRSASSSSTAWASAAPSSGSVPAPSSSSSTSDRASTCSSTSRSCFTKARERREVLGHALVVADDREALRDTGSRAPSRAGTWSPACAISASRPSVLSATVLPPALGPVITSSGRSASISMIDRDDGRPPSVAQSWARSSGWRAPRTTTTRASATAGSIASMRSASAPRAKIRSARRSLPPGRRARAARPAPRR